MDLPLNFTGEFKLKFNSNFTIPIKSDDKIGLEEINAPKLDDRPLIDFNADYNNSPLFQIEDIPTPLNYYPIEENSISISNLPVPEHPTPHVNLKRKAPIVYIPPVVEEYPVELKTLLQPLICLLCNVQSNSWVSAKQHYDSKNHEKKIKVWLEEWSRRTGESVPIKKQKIVERQILSNVFHCDICDIQLTSTQHADQHYRGRKHQMVVYKKSQQLGFGYYRGPDPRFGIGAGLISKPETKIISDNPEMKNKYCDVCCIYVSSESQLQTHFEGSKHTKKLKSIGAPPHSKPEDTIFSSLEKPTTTLERDISIYRTPSGKYYCQSCDITLSTEILFTQHLDCKKHIKTIKKD